MNKMQRHTVQDILKQSNKDGHENDNEITSLKNVHLRLQTFTRAQ